MKKYSLALVGVCLCVGAVAASAADLRIGIIGCDTSHAPAFTKLLNDATDTNHISGGKVVAAFKGGSKDIKSSWSRVDEYAKQLQEKYGVKMVDTVEELCTLVDVVLVESVDGRPHLDEVTPVMKAGKPVFIDKPVGGTLRDVIKIDKLARELHVPWFSSSAYRYYDSMIEVKNANIGELRGAFSYGPCELEPHHPDLFWYGIHTTEALYTIMGSGCETVARTHTPDTDEVTGVWADGKIGTFRGIRNGASAHKIIVFGSKAIVEQKGDGDYLPLVRQIMHFFETKVSPIPNAETIEIYAFMEAADESKREGGKPVKLSDVLKHNGGEYLLPLAGSAADKK